MFEYKAFFFFLIMLVCFLTPIGFNTNDASFAISFNLSKSLLGILFPEMWKNA